MEGLDRSGLVEELDRLIRIGSVSSVNQSERTARVQFDGDGGLVSAPLSLLRRPINITVQPSEGHSHTASASQWLPKVGDFVLCIFLPNGEGDGFVLGVV